MDGLNKKQLKFVEEYVATRNAKMSAIAAGYSEKTAESQGSRLLSNAKVAVAVNEGIQRASENASRSAVDAINDIVRIARLAEEKGQLQTAMKGFELEAKHHGGFIERKADVNTNGEDVPREISVKFVDVPDKAK